jgi:hypothetical protein
MRMPVRIRNTSAVREYLVRLFDRAVTERVENRVEKKLEATFDIITDEKLMADLRRADQQADEDARPYDEIRRDLGRA